jgi:predicted Rossmann fold nucleotide-binding protein DprA/Smf involved in DNA uptake
MNILNTKQKPKVSEYLDTISSELIRLLENAPTHGTRYVWNRDLLQGFKDNTNHNEDRSFPTMQSVSKLAEATMKQTEPPVLRKEVRAQEQDHIVELLALYHPTPLKTGDIARTLGKSVSAVGHILQKPELKGKVKVAPQYGYWKLPN